MHAVTLEEEVAQLREQIAALAERVRLDAVARRFLARDHAIRERDYFLYLRETPTRLSNVSSEGKWTFWNGQNVVEPHAIPNQEDHERLYTLAEVAEIVGKSWRLRDALDDALGLLETHDDDRGVCAYPGEREWIDATRKEFAL